MTIFPKLLLTFLLVIVPIFLVSLQMNRMGTESVREKILSSMQMRVQANMGSLETETERIIRLHQQYVLDDDVMKLGTNSPILPYYDILLLQKRVQNKLWVMKNSNLYVAEAKAYFPEIATTILSLNYEAGMTGQEVSELQELKRSQLSPVAYWHGKLLINSFYPDPAYSTKPPIYILQAELSQSGLQAFLRSITNGPGEGSILFNEKEEWTLWSGRDDGVQSEVKRFVKQQRLPDSFGQGTLTIDNRIYYVTFQRSKLLNMDLVLYIPKDQILGPLTKYRMWFWILFGLSLAVVSAFSYWIYRLIHYPLRQMVRAFHKVEKGDLSISIQHRNYDEFQYLYGQFNSMVHKLHQSIQEVYESRIMAQRSELKQLQSQINPHFLYNTYFMVHRMAESYDVDNVVKATQHLGDYFLYITRNSSDDAPLDEEWNHTAAYLEIQQMRFSSRMEARLKRDAQRTENVRIPRLTLQPLVENAYQHGLKSKTSGGIVFMALEALPGGDIRISVEDNGESLDDADLLMLKRKLESTWQDRTEKTGLLNVHLRLRLKFGEGYGLQLSRSPLGGMKVDLTIPAGEPVPKEE
ncbi:histidine kinase [Paenibacillus aurantius]|uniref:Histidine kinase n=1 Tax=Paenibacillus aurantius TaxID=2918900 RepID=A0AA96LG40_9BACL|nr:histidine kinase [Paenibacillus aurantius]WNQ10892.1 histidine kinase [Paenibacillus aurantius]